MKSLEPGHSSSAPTAVSSAREKAEPPRKPARPPAGKKAPGGSWSARLKGKTRTLIALLVLTVAVVIGFHRPILYWMGQRLVVRDVVHRADAIVVLAGEKGERVDHGVDLLRKGYAPLLVMSGGPSEAGVPLARLMKEQAERAGVPAASIVTEDESLDTGEDARYTLRLARQRGWRSIILVTSPYHARRALKLFRAVYAPAGIEVVSCPVERSWFSAAGWWTRKKDCKAVLMEYAKGAWYSVSSLSTADSEPPAKAGESSPAASP